MVILEKKYGLKITSSEEGKKIMYSIKTIAEYIRANKKDVL
jgi:acyl carrier protein